MEDRCFEELIEELRELKIREAELTVRIERAKLARVQRTTATAGPDDSNNHAPPDGPHTNGQRDQDVASAKQPETRLGLTLVMSSNSSTAADTTTSGLTTDTGRSNPSGRGATGRSGGRGRGRGGAGRGHGRSTSSRPRNTGFKGTTTEMNGNVFECYDEQTDRRQYMKTLEALEGYAKKTLKYAEDLSPLFADEMRLPTLDKPTRPGEGADETDIAIWNEDIRD